MPPYNAEDTSTGTAAKAISLCNGRSAYGVNSSLSPSTRQMRRDALSDIQEKTGKFAGSKNLGQAVFLTHAEAQALLRLKAKGGCMQSVLLISDRPTCTFCTGGLPVLKETLGIGDLKISSGF